MGRRTALRRRVGQGQDRAEDEDGPLLRADALGEEALPVRLGEAAADEGPRAPAKPGRAGHALRRRRLRQLLRAHEARHAGVLADDADALAEEGTQPLMGSVAAGGNPAKRIPSTRSMAARTMASLVGKWRKRAASETPTSRAMASDVNRASPCSAMTFSAASAISRRLEPAGLRAVMVILISE